MANHGEWKKLRQRLIEQGLQVVLSRGSHYKIYRGQHMIASLPSSSGGGRGLQNAKAKLRQHGVTL